MSLTFIYVNTQKLTLLMTMFPPKHFTNSSGVATQKSLTYVLRRVVVSREIPDIVCLCQYKKAPLKTPEIMHFRPRYFERKTQLYPDLQAVSLWIRLSNYVTCSILNYLSCVNCLQYPQHCSRAPGSKFFALLF